MLKPQFLVTVPEERVDELARLMTEHGFEFDADLHQFAVPFENTDPMFPAHFGHHIPDLVQGLNRFLAEQKIHPKIREDVHNWSYTQRADFLELTVNEFTWYGFRVGGAWWRDDDRPWSEIMEKYRDVPYDVVPV